MHPQQVFAILLVGLLFSCYLCQCGPYQKLSHDGRRRSVEAGNSTRIVRVKLIKCGELDTLEALRKCSTSQANDVTKSSSSIGLKSQLIGLTKIGTPQQEFRLIFATSYSKMWIPTNKCKECDNKRRYDSSKSSTYIQNGTYNHENMNWGFYSSDNIVVGDMKIERQTFTEMLEVDTNFRGETLYDGLFGLGEDQPGEMHVPTPLRNMYQQGLIDQEVFAIYQNPDQVASPGGEITFGGIDKGRFSDTLLYLPCLLESIWSVQVDLVSTRDGQARTCEKGCIAQFDTTTPFIYGPPDQVRLINDAFGAQIDEQDESLFVLPDCDLSKLDNLQFIVAGKSLELTPAQYILQAKRNDGEVVCVSALRAQEDLFGHWYLGTSFVGHIYTVFDQTNKQMGFAQID